MAERSEVDVHRFLAHITAQSLPAENTTFSTESRVSIPLNQDADQTRTSSDQSKGSSDVVDARPKSRSASSNEIADPKLRGALNRALKAQNEANEKGVNKKTRDRLLKQAVGNYNRALRLATQQSEGEKNAGLEAFIHKNIGAAYAAMDSLDDAIDSFRKAIKLSPYDPIAHHNYGSACMRSGKTDADTYHSLGVSCMLLGDSDKGLKHLTKAINLGVKNPYTYIYLATYYILINDLDESINHIEKAVGLSPKDANLYHELGILYGESNNLNKAIEYLEKSIELNPEDTAVYYNLGTIHQLDGNLGKAIESYSKSVDINPKFADVTLKLGTAYLLNSNFVDAIKHLESAIEMDPDNAAAYLNLGHAFGKSNRLEDAIECCRKAIAIAPEYIDAHHNLAATYARDGDLEAALKSRHQAIRIKPDFAEAYILRGLTYHIKGEQDEAEEDFAVALSLDPGLYREEYAVIFPDIPQKLEEAEAPWNELRDALLHAQAELEQWDAAPEQRERWAALIDGALEAVGRFAPLRKDILRLNRAAKYLAVEECRDVRLELGRALNEALDRLNDLAAFQRETSQQALSLEASGDEKNGFASALLRLSRSLEAVKIEDADDVFDKIQAENAIQSLRYLETRIKTGGQTFTRDERNER